MGGRAVSFTIPGRVGGKGRPRATIRAGHAAVYTPAKTVSMEAMVRDFGAAAMGGAPPMEGALQLFIVVSLNRPPSWSRKKVAANPFPTGRPDLDNVGKLIGDALNKIVWNDDSQIADLHIGRRFVEGAESVEISVARLSGDEIARAAA